MPATPVRRARRRAPAGSTAMPMLEPPGLSRIVTRRIDSPFGSWSQSEWRPPELAGLVERLWHFEGTLAHARERTFPNGLLELIVHLGERYRVVEGERTEICAPACFGGLYARALLVEAPVRPGPVLGMRLRPAGAYALLGAPLAPLAGLTVDLGDLIGRAAGAELLERCADAATAEERLRLAARWVAERVARSAGPEPAIGWIAGQIERRAGEVAIARLRHEAGLSKAGLATAFREQIGVAPKLYARIHRFRRALAALDGGAGPLVELALDAGYYDQPHMNAEFRELAGMAPREFLAAARYPGSVSLAESAA